jgi:aquaporin Z
VVSARRVFVGGGALAQLWLFWVAPIIGAILAGWTYLWLVKKIHQGEFQLRATDHEAKRPTN